MRYWWVNPKPDAPSEKSRVANLAAPAAKKKFPVVFISSTVEDLKPYRVAANYEAQRAGFKVLMQEYWVARGQKPPLEECLTEVSKASVLVAIVAHRHGWVPA